MDVNECEEDPGICRNGGSCQNFVKTDKTDRSAGYVCTCVPGYVGVNCNAAMKEQRLGLSYGAIAAVVISAFILLREYILHLQESVVARTFESRRVVNRC